MVSGAPSCDVCAQFIFICERLPTLAKRFGGALWLRLTVLARTETFPALFAWLKRKTGRTRCPVWGFSLLAQQRVHYMSGARARIQPSLLLNVRRSFFLPLRMRLRVDCTNLPIVYGVLFQNIAHHRSPPARFPYRLREDWHDSAAFHKYIGACESCLLIVRLRGDSVDIES